MRKLEILHQLETYLLRLGYGEKTIEIVIRSCLEFMNRMEIEQVESIQDITSADIIDHYNYLNERPNKITLGGLSSKYIDHHIYSLKIFFEWQQTIQSIEGNPMSALSFPKGESKQMEILTQNEIKQLYEICESWKERTLLSIFYGCGLRRMEGERLDIKDVHFRSGILYVRKGKGSKRRAVPMSKKVAEPIYNYIHEERQNPNNLKALVINKKDGRMRGQTYGILLARLMKRTEIKKHITLHCLRHSIATHLLESGMNVEKVQDFLGHKHLESTMRYTRVSKELLIDKTHEFN